MVPGPVAAAVLRVIDGDTLEIRARIWLGQDVTVMVRLSGVDAPELRGKCPEERAKALAARALIDNLIGGGRVILRNVIEDKYGGRVLAKVETAEGKDLGEALLAAGLAHAYAGKKREGWCAD
ncbi:MAG: nuclease [Alphaproteobacteria bacterium]|nr:nuclease [Alphaproteobacteria bacterium]